MNNQSDSESLNDTGEKPTVTLTGTVEKIVKVGHGQPEKAQITIEGADHLYREIRIPNTLEDSSGEKVKLKPGTEVDVVIEAPSEGVEKKEDAD